MAWRGTRGAWLLATMALGACQPLGELPLPPTALGGGGGGKALAERREIVATATPQTEPSAARAEDEDDAHATDED